MRLQDQSSIESREAERAAPATLTRGGRYSRGTCTLQGRRSHVSLARLSRTGALTHEVGAHRACTPLQCGALCGVIEGSPGRSEHNSFGVRRATHCSGLGPRGGCSCCIRFRATRPGGRGSLGVIRFGGRGPLESRSDGGRGEIARAERHEQIPPRRFPQRCRAENAASAGRGVDCGL